VAGLNEVRELGAELLNLPLIKDADARQEAVPMEPLNLLICQLIPLPVRR
jgi:hypothetical protein